MRARPFNVLAAVAAVTLVLAGCDQAMLESEVQAKTPSRPAHNAPARSVPAQPEAMQLLLGPGAMPVPPALSSTFIGGLAAGKADGEGFDRPLVQPRHHRQHRR